MGATVDVRDLPAGKTNFSGGDLTPERPATQNDIVKYDVADEKIKKLDTSDSFNSSDPKQRLFFVAFDGTSNDAEAPNEVLTNTAILSELIPTGSNVQSTYQHGVGTRGSELQNFNDSRIKGVRVN